MASSGLLSVRLRWRFTLRTLLVLVTVFCLALGGWMDRSFRQRTIAQSLLKQGLWVRYSSGYGTKLDKNHWYGYSSSAKVAFSSDVHEFVWGIGLSPTGDITDEDCETIAQLKRLREIISPRASLGDEGIGRLARLSLLEHLDFGQTRVTPQGLLRLAPAPRLKKLEVDYLAGSVDEWSNVRRAFPDVAILGQVRTERGMLDMSTMQFVPDPGPDLDVLHQHRLEVEAVRKGFPETWYADRERIALYSRNDPDRAAQACIEMFLASPDKAHNTLMQAILAPDVYLSKFDLRHSLENSYRREAVPYLIMAMETWGPEHETECNHSLELLTGVRLDPSPQDKAIASMPLAARWRHFWEENGDRIKVDRQNLSLWSPNYHVTPAGY